MIMITTTLTRTPTHETGSAGALWLAAAKLLKQE